MPKPYCKLRSRMLSEDVNQVTIADILGVTQATISYKLMGNTPFTNDEMYIIATILSIPDEELSIYFPRRETQCRDKKKVEKITEIMRKVKI